MRLTLARIDCSDLISLLCAQDVVRSLWQQRALHRCGQAKIESEMRPAARALLQELLDDGQHSPEEILKLANQYVYLAFKSQSGLAEVRRVVPAFEMRPVEAEAIRRSLDAMESLSKLQALVGDAKRATRLRILNTRWKRRLTACTHSRSSLAPILRRPKKPPPLNQRINKGHSFSHASIA